MLCYLFASFEVLEKIGSIYEGQPNLARILLDQTYEKMPALIMAMSLAGFGHHRQKSEKITQYLIDLIIENKESDLLRFASIPDRLGRISLHIACQHGLLNIVKQLIE